MTTPVPPICRIIAGPNGAGKTTFALTCLRQFPDAQAFVNADLIAAGLSPLEPQQQLVAASRLMLGEIEAHISAGRS
jgi:predicted ABC-type ATPase